jgi:AcrR family transcriptional regulator
MECSPMAIYSYFADKQALLTVLTLEGFEKLPNGSIPPFIEIRLPGSGK